MRPGETDKRKQATQRDYAAIRQLYIADFGNVYDHFDFVDQVLSLCKQRGLDPHPIVDLGSGSGTIIDYLLMHGISNIVAVEITPEFCHLLEKQYHRERTISIFCVDMVEYLRARVPATVGAYIANFSLIHIPDEEIDKIFVTAQVAWSEGTTG